MKFRRNLQPLPIHLDAAPFAGVLFCLLIFILLCSLVYTPGVLIRLPSANSDLPGVPGPTITVALDPSGNFYYKSQLIQESNLVAQLKAEVARQSEPVTLVVMGDLKVDGGQWIHVRDLAASAGIRDIYQTVLPRVSDAPANGKKP